MIDCNTIIAILKKQYNLNIYTIKGLELEFLYSWIMPSGRTKLVMKSLKNNVLTMTFKTSFGIFHQEELDAIDIYVVLLENVSGKLESHRHDLMMSRLTYPNDVSRAKFVCKIDI